MLGPNNNIKLIYCEHCKKYVGWYSNQGPYVCAECKNLLGWWMGEKGGLPHSWNKEATATYVVPYITWEGKEKP